MNHFDIRSGSRPTLKKCLTRRNIIFPLVAVLLLCFWLSAYFFDWNLNISKGVQTRIRMLDLREARAKTLYLQDLLIRLEKLYFAKKPPSFKIALELQAIIRELHPGHLGPGTKPSFEPISSFPKPFNEAFHDTTGNIDQSIKDIVTIILNFERTTKTKIIQLIEDFQVSYPGISIIVKVGNISKADLGSWLPDSTTRREVMAIATAEFWTQVIEKVRSRYVLIARDIYRFSDSASSLESLVQMLNNTLGVSAVGGATRNSSGHWFLGCYQTHLQNYVLKYKNGDHFSLNGCMICDYIDGPFMVETALLKRFLPDENLEQSVVFQDMFLRLGGQSHTTMVCPDVMFYGNGLMDSTKMYQKEAWITLARKWELNRIVIERQSFRVLLRFSCLEAGISCSLKIRATSSYTVPVCCQEEFANALLFWKEFCEQYTMRYQFDSGTCLGAVKMSDFIPWDIDGDGGYQETDYNFIKNKTHIFKQNGFLLKKFVDPVCCDKRQPNNLKRSYFQIWSPSMKIEMWGDWNMTYDTFLKTESNEVSSDTMMELHGVWVMAPPNPGHYSRKRYGRECLRHAQSWSQTGKNSSWDPYEPGVFKTCKNHDHHACLDRFSKDGSIAFLVPN